MQAATESAVVSSVQSIMGAATGIQATKTSPVIDQRFTEYVLVTSPTTALGQLTMSKEQVISINGLKTTSKRHIRR